MQKAGGMFIAAVVLAAFTSSALAWGDMDRMRAADELGNMLGSETACGLTYDQDAIKRYIDREVPADDMQFASMLNLMTIGARARIAGMSASLKTAQCRQVERAAKSAGFIK